MAYKIRKPMSYVGEIEDFLHELTIAKCLLSLCYSIFDDIKMGSESEENQMRFNEAAFLLRLFEDKLEGSLEELEEASKRLKASLTLPELGK